MKPLFIRVEHSRIPPDVFDDKTPNWIDIFEKEPSPAADLTTIITHEIIPHGSDEIHIKMSDLRQYRGYNL